MRYFSQSQVLALVAILFLTSHSFARSSLTGSLVPGFLEASAPLPQLPPGFEGTIGGTQSDRFGESVAKAGDINSDGIADILIGVQLFDPAVNLVDAGAVVVVSGADASSVLLMIHGDESGAWFGTSVAGDGDFNGDGICDIVVGASLDDRIDPNAPGSVIVDAGSVTVFSGSDGSVLYKKEGDSAHDQLGHSVAFLRDVNNDGCDEVIVGARFDDNSGADSGSVFVLLGPNGSGHLALDGFASGDGLGGSVADAGDVNGDGINDIIAGAEGVDVNAPGQNLNNIFGGAFVYSGATGALLYAKIGSAAGDNFGVSVSAAGDVNFDGYADFAVGARAADDGTNNLIDCGSVSVFSGIDGSQVFQTLGQGSGDEFGWRIDYLGSISPTAGPGLVVGARLADSCAPQSGKAYVVDGQTGTLVRVHSGDSAVDRLGWSVAGLGDVNGDGIDEYCSGAAFSDLGGTDSGAVYIYASGVPIVQPYFPCAVDPGLELNWVPDPSQQSLLGFLHCTGATPGADGLFGISLARVDFDYLGVPLLIANDSTNLVSSGGFGFDSLGEFSSPLFSRAGMVSVGIQLHIQFFESSPLPASSNGVSLLFVP